jgi:hypothetical protein
MHITIAYTRTAKVERRFLLSECCEALGSLVKGFDNPMKLLPALVSVFIVFGCGILSVIFDLPERYIERDVTPEEMVGTWNIISDSEADVREFVAKFSDWHVTYL